MIYNLIKNTVLFLTAIFAIQVGSFASSLSGLDLTASLNINTQIKGGVQEFSHIDQNHNNHKIGASIEIFDIEEEDDEESYSKQLFPLPFSVVFVKSFIVFSNTQFKQLLSGNLLPYFNSFQSLNVAFCVFRL